MNIKKGTLWVHRSLFEVIVMNCFGKCIDSTESLIPHEEEDEVVNLCREHERLEIVEIKEEEDEEDQTGEDEVGEEMEEEEEVKLLTDEEV